jgi:SCP-2 sterol transfer family
MRGATSMASTASGDPVSDFFAALAAPGHMATFERESATLRFDVADGDRVQRWHVTVSDGDTTVTRRNDPADVIVRIDSDRMAQLVTGRLNGFAALLRGLLTCEGSAAAAIMFQRCLPGPPGSKGRVAPITSKAVMARRRPE